MEFIDYYKILELDKTASDEEIKKAYRKKARTLHPDLNPNDKQASVKFQQLSEANTVLGDPEKRKKYDKYGKDWERGGEYERYKQSNQGRRQSYSSGAEGFAVDDDFSDFFASMFGGQTRSQAKYKGQDYHSEINLTLNDILKTHEQTFKVNDKNVKVNIHAGIENGQTLKLTGLGAPGMNGGPNGDLFIKINIANTTTMKRTGNDLHTECALDLYTAILGGEVTIETMLEKVKLKIAPGTQNGAKVRLKGKGCPVYKKENEFGDLFVSYQIKIPDNLNDKQKELFEELAQLSKQ